MSDSFEFTLHNPLSKEDWDKLTDVELEKTNHIWFKTPSGKKIDYIPANVLDKIRAEIERIGGDDEKAFCKNLNESYKQGLKDALKVIEKYKEESEEQHEQT